MEMVLAVGCAGMGVVMLVAAVQLAKAGRGLRQAAKGLDEVGKSLREMEAGLRGEQQEQGG